MPDRREFLSLASASALMLAAHRVAPWAAPLVKEEAAPAGGHRIRSLRLRTAAPLERMKAFYKDALGLPVLAESSTELTIGGGATPITFVTAEPEHGSPFYHFAFNIPENKVRAARDWQAERSEILPVFPQLRDPSFPDDVVHFSNWNAHSVFFFDPAENVVEYIGRHDLDNGAGGSFGPKDILYASEIAFIADDVPKMAAALQESFALPQYRSGSDRFRALGDELGLVLVFEIGRQLGLAHEKPKPAGVFPTEAEIAAVEGASLAVEGFPYSIRSQLKK